MSLSKICISVLDNTKHIDEQNINEIKEILEKL